STQLYGASQQTWWTTWTPSRCGTLSVLSTPSCPLVSPRLNCSHPCTQLACPPHRAPAWAAWNPSAASTSTASWQSHAPTTFCRKHCPTLLQLTSCSPTSVATDR